MGPIWTMHPLSSLSACSVLGIGTLHIRDSLLLRCKRTLHLAILYRSQYLLEVWTGSVAHCEEVVASNKSGRSDGLRRRGCQELLNRFVRCQVPVTCGAVQAVQFEVLWEARQTDEALQGGFTHLGHVFELHVVGHQGADLVGVVIGKTEAAADRGGHGNAYVHMSIEADAIAGDGCGAEG